MAQQDPSTSATHDGRLWALNAAGDSYVPVQLGPTGGIPVEGSFSGGGDGAVVDGVTAAIRASVRDYVASNPLAVALTDATGAHYDAGATVGGATAAKQDTGNTSLGTIDTSTAAASTVLGATGDAKVVGDNTGTASAKLRGLNYLLALVIDTGNSWLKVSIQNATLAVTQSGSWVLSAGAALIGKVGIDQTTPGTTNAVAATNLPTTVDTNSGNKSASTPRVAIATDDINLAALNAVHGTTAGAAVITDANGTIQQYLRGIIKLAITAGGFLVTATLNASSTLIGYVGRKFTVGNIATLTTTNFSGLTTTSGWQSAAIAPAGASDIIFSLTTLGAAGSTLLVDFYIAETNGTSYTDGATGSEGTFTAANRKNSRYLGSLQLNTTNSVVGELRLSDIMLCPNSSIALIAINNSGGTISATGGNTVFTYQLVY